MLGELNESALHLFDNQGNGFLILELEHMLHQVVPEGIFDEHVQVLDDNLPKESVPIGNANFEASL